MRGIRRMLIGSTSTAPRVDVAQPPRQRSSPEATNGSAAIADSVRSRAGEAEGRAKSVY